jgi:hypothetical protein
VGWDDDDWSYHDEGPEREYDRDPTIDWAKEELKKFFSKPQHRETVFYVMQLQVIFEKSFFHWITYKAIDELVDENLLADDIQNTGREYSRSLYISSSVAIN